MNFDEDKWKQITAQWDAEDADGLESDKDAMDLADPKTWAEQDAKTKLGKAFEAAGAAPADDAAPDDAPADDSPPPPPEQPLRLRPDSPNSPATAGAGQKGVPSLLPHAEPAAPPSDPSTLDWKGLASRLDRAQSGQSLARASENMFANIGAKSGYRPNEHAGEGDVERIRGQLELLKSKQGQETHDASMAKSKSELGVKHAMDDPNSLQSQKARDAIKSMGIESLPRGFDNFSANDIHSFVKTGDLVSLQEHHAAEKDRVAKADAVTAQKAGALADRKALMLTSYPDHANEINSLNDLGNAESLQRTLDSRGTAGAAQAHADAARADSQKFQRDQQARSEAFQKDLKEWERNNQNMTAEQKSAFEGFGEADATIDELKKHFSETSTTAGKIGAMAPRAISGALGLPGTTFEANEEAAASNLARAIDGGQAKPGTIGQIMRMMPRAGDNDATKNKLAEDLRAFMHAKGKAFMGSLTKEGVRAPGGDKVKVRKGKETLLVDPSDVDAAAADGYMRVQ